MPLYLAISGTKDKLVIPGCVFVSSKKIGSYKI